MTARVMGVSIMVLAVQIAAQSGNVRDHDPTWVAPESAASKPNPLANRPETAAGGRKIFEQRCTTCHGDDARGTDRGPNLLAANVQAQTDGALFWKISGGNTRAGMPSFSFLPDPQRWQVILHLRSEAKAGTPLARKSSAAESWQESRAKLAAAGAEFRSTVENSALSTRRQ